MSNAAPARMDTVSRSPANNNAYLAMTHTSPFRQNTLYYIKLGQYVDTTAAMIGRHGVFLTVR